MLEPSPITLNLCYRWHSMFAKDLDLTSIATYVFLICSQSFDVCFFNLEHLPPLQQCLMEATTVDRC